MSEWWTYRPSDFLLFSPRTYYRLFELYNAEVWPGQLPALALGLLLWVALWQRRPWAPRAACVLLGAAWLWVAWAFHWQRFAGVNWAATWFAAAFAGQGLLLWLAALVPGGRIEAPARAHRLGLALLLALLLPALGLLLGRPWQQAEVFGLAPDPTVLATFAVLLLLPHGGARARSLRGASTVWWLWPLPLLWAGITGMTLAAMHAAAAPLLPAAALVALALRLRQGVN